MSVGVLMLFGIHIHTKICAARMEWDVALCEDNPLRSSYVATYLNPQLFLFLVLL
jgi:hypothetical protein